MRCPRKHSHTPKGRRIVTFPRLIEMRHTHAEIPFMPHRSHAAKLQCYNIESIRHIKSIRPLPLLSTICLACRSEHLAPCLQIKPAQLTPASHRQAPLWIYSWCSFLEGILYFGQRPLNKFQINSSPGWFACMSTAVPSECGNVTKYTPPPKLLFSLWSPFITDLRRMPSTRNHSSQPGTALRPPGAESAQ